MDSSNGARPVEIARPVMLHRWETVTFLHWRFEPFAVQRLLPPNLEVETADGSAWVGLVPFYMRVALPRARSVPWLSRFCETNVRTYVRDQEGRSGIWFFSLDAARLGAVAVARTTYRLPYFWSKMRLRRDGAVVRYACRRRWPGPRGAMSRVTVEVGDAYAPGTVGELVYFLTARWILFSVAGAGHRFARASHPPWPLYRARAIDVDDELLEAADLPAPDGPPLVHFSPGVTVRIGRPESSPSEFPSPGR